MGSREPGVQIDGVQIVEDLDMGVQRDENQEMRVREMGV